MSGRTDPSRDGYDVVVVGAGLGGISTAAVLARSGLSVLAVERQHAVGGCARAFRRGGYVFDPAVHSTIEVGPGRLVNRLLDWLGSGEDCRFVQHEVLYGTAFPGFQLHPPRGLEQCVASHKKALPEDAAGVRAFFELHQRCFREGLNMAMSLSLAQLGEAVDRFPTFFRYRNATLAEVLDDTVSDPRAKAVLGSVWPYFGLPPSRLSFMALSPLLGILIEHGPWHCVGSFQRFADAFAAGLERHGGELLTDTAVESIAIEDGTVAGVVLEGGRNVRAPAVVSNADGTHTFKELVGLEHLPRGYVRRLERYELSLSACAAYAATTLDLAELGAAHESFLYQRWDHEETYRDILKGSPGGMWSSVPTLVDPSLAPPGEHLVIMSSLAPWDIGKPWEEEKESFGERMLAEFDATLYPGLRDKLTHFEVAGPPDVHRSTGTRYGALYGWALTPRQVGSKRLPRKGPLPGLWLVGQWSEEGPGSFRAVLSGLTTATMLLREAGVDADVPTFRSENLPQQVVGR